MFKTLINFYKKHWKSCSLLVLAVVLLFALYQNTKADPAGTLSMTVKRDTLTSGFTANGKIKAERAVDLKFGLPAKVSWISVKEGDTVKANQRIAGLDSTSLYAAYQTALNNNRSAIASADSTLDSVQGHDNDESFSQRATRTTAEVARDNSYNAILTASNALSSSVLVSPFAGTVVDTNSIVAGTHLSGADIEAKYIRIVDLDSFYFEAKVDEVDYAKVKVGQEAIVSVDAFPENTCKGEVKEIGRNGEETSGGVITIPVKIDLSDCDLNLAVNLNGQARFIETKAEDVIVLQKKYIISKDNKNFVWKQTGKTLKNRTLIPVKTGLISSTEVEINDGISEGDVVIYLP